MIVFKRHSIARVLTLILTLLVTSAAGQRIYLDKNKAQVADSSQAQYYKIKVPGDKPDSYVEYIYFLTGEKRSEDHFITREGKNLKEGISASWFITGKPESEAAYKNGESIGKSLTWYENGQMKSETDYQNPAYEKVVVTYWKNGTLKRKDFFSKEKLEKGTCFDSLGSEVRHFDYEIMARYPGGDNQLLSDISRNTNYPVRLRDQGVQGRVVVRFAVEEDGSINSVGIMEGSVPDFNKEAIRVVQSLRKFKPAYLDGEPVTIFYMVPISFKLR
jgi:periplasmic protein TonB